MPKLRVLSGREVSAILTAQGFAFARQKGSHMMMVEKVEGGSIIIPIPDHKEIAVGTLSDIIRQSRLPRDLFETK
jgi:predicted RNA binding protein YcfA (HicA-like mRNA interferase family)